MNAKELTEKYYWHKEQIKNLQEAVDFLEQETRLLRRLYDDLKIDVMMLEDMRKNEICFDVFRAMR